MAEGHCNCGSIKVKIPMHPPPSILCYCDNCRRSGSSTMSVNYIIERADIDIIDPNGVLKGYVDGNTKSGITITRHFCGNCGSLVISSSPIETKVFLKAGIFDKIEGPVGELFKERKAEWLMGLKV